MHFCIAKNTISASKLSALSNVSKSTIFHHFKTTQEIPEAALKMIMEKMIKPIDDLKDENLGGSLNDLGASVIIILEDYKKLYKSFFLFIMRACLIKRTKSLWENF